MGKLCLRLFIGIFCLSLLASCTEKPQERPVYLKSASFVDLPGWGQDNVAAALLPLARSCGRRLMRGDEDLVGSDGIGGRAADWKPLCRQAVSLLFSGDSARNFFEENFIPYEVRSGRWESEGLFTGYYEPLLKGAREKKDGYATPLLKAPDDLVVADLGLFYPELAGKKITGRAQGGKVLPVETRADIEKGGLSGKAPELVWVSDPIDAFFLQVQGSGRIDLDDGSTMQVGYAAQNGRTYVAIGKALIERGELTKENVSLQTIRTWLKAHPQEAQAVMNLNPSFVFFRELNNTGGPLGAEGVPLTPLRSIAVDGKKMPYGVPLYLDAQMPEAARDQRLQKLMVAQDTGGAIKGAVRGDIFWGFGDAAENAAGSMKSKGRYWMLLPKTVQVPDKMKIRWW